jgi:hypothetical protein
VDARDLQTPSQAASAAADLVEAFADGARTLDALGEWLLMNAHRLEDDRAAAAGYAGMPPFLPFMVREVLGMAEQSRDIAGKLANYTTAPSGAAGGLGFERLRLRRT